MNTRLPRYAAPAALVSGLMGILGFVSLSLFFALEAPQASIDSQQFHFWGTVSDISGPLTMIPLMFVMLALYRIERDRAAILSQAAMAIGLIGAVSVSILSILLVVRILTFEQQVVPILFANALVGLWLILANHIGRVQRLLPGRLAWLGIAVGTSQVLYPVIFPLIGGADFYTDLGSNYLLLTITSIIFLVSYVGFPIWTIWLGRIWSKQRIQTPAEAAYAG